MTSDVDGEELGFSPGTWQQILDSFYGNPYPATLETPAQPTPAIVPEEDRIGLRSESIDPDAYRDFMRGL